jgi:hypothetical protein
MKQYLFFVFVKLTLLLLFQKEIFGQDEDISVFTECPNSCHGHGSCDVTGSCHCWKPYTGSDCSRRICPNGTAWVDFATANNVAHGIETCSNMGYCNTENGRCVCREGFEGHACERIKCPVNVDTSIECSGNGHCMSMRMAAITQNDMNLFRSIEYTNWEADMFWGCVCNYGWHGHDCSLKSCPTGDDPVTNTNTDNEIQLIDCAADGGTFKIKYRDQITSALSYAATNTAIKTELEKITWLAEGVTVNYVTGGSTACATSGAAISITFTNQPGNLPDLILLKEGLTISSGTVVLNTISSGSQNTYGGATITSVDGNRENVECSNQGTCNEVTGACTCRIGFQSSNGALNGQLGVSGKRGDCGYRPTVTTTCDTDDETMTKCNSLGGTCSNDGNLAARCSCIAPTTTQFGYSGHMCSLIKCPIGKVWFAEAITATQRDTSYAECSGAGACDRLSGECTCQVWAAGRACEKMACPVTGTAQCSAKGTCSSISDWATHSRNALGDLRGVTYTESDTTWDANRIYACLCNRKIYVGPKTGNVVQAFGYACSRHICPHGDIPDTINQNYEVQKFYCKADGGSFKFTFRGETTRAIAYNAVASEADEDTSSTSGTGYRESVQKKLHELVEITEVCHNNICSGVTVTFDAGSAICSSSGVTTSITFKSEFGDLPLLVPNSGSLTISSGSVETKIYESVKGTKEMVECAGRGLCNVLKGQCECHTGYISSDGNGNIGQRADCGAYTAFQKNEGVSVRM